MTEHTEAQAATRALQARADRVQAELTAQNDAWRRSGWTRRRFIGGMGMVGAAALASQFVTSRAAFATSGDTATNTLVVIFLRGAADGLRILVPNSSDLGLGYLQTVRAGLVPPDNALLAMPGSNGWALNAALKPVYDTLWATGELAFVPAVSSPGISRSHFQAQQYLEKGGSEAASDGWLDRLLAGLGAGTTFRAVSLGSATPASLLGEQPSISMDQLKNFTFSGSADTVPAAETALSSLYRGMDPTLGEDVPIALAALDTAAAAQAAPRAQNGAAYASNNDFATALADLAQMLRAEVGVQVATIDVGGWDTHTDEARDLDANLLSVAQALSAFTTDLGPDRRKRVTVVVQTEFGRRVEMNSSGGTDHGHGSVMWLLGGGLAGSGVYGNWTPLTATSLDGGDVPAVNNPFDVFGEVAQKRLGAGDLSTVFPGHALSPLGVATAA